MSGRATPPLAPLADVARRFTERGLHLALGGSGLLYAHGLVPRVRDWDATTDASLDEARAALADLRAEHHGSSGVHADDKLVVHGGTVEVIVRMAFFVGDGRVRIPTLEHGRWHGVALGSLEAWGVAYALMGRAERSALAFGALAARGVDPAAVAWLLAQPLPGELAARLRALPARAEPSAGV